MLPSNRRAWTRGQILFTILSILAVFDATTASSTAAPPITTAVPSGTTVSPQRTTNSVSVTVQSSTIKLSSAALPEKSESTVPTVHNSTVSGSTSGALRNETNEINNKNTTEVQVSQGSSTTLTSIVTTIDLVYQTSENTPFTKTPELTTQVVQLPNGSMTPQPTSARIEVLSSHTTAAPGIITCLGLGSFTSTSQVACFQNEEDTTCETLDKEKREELRTFLCGIMNTSDCNVTIHSSEVQPKCILWVPTSADAETKLRNIAAKNPFPTEIKWEQISDHQTKSQKTMIALVTCGILLAAFILAGYFLNNRESWSPGRQRLGEDPYCTETDSQGNTLVSVSAHAQDKPNNGTRENGTGQTVSPTAKNGHSSKKQTVSDTEL
ncbi:hematopoietic progenitor cell antigen CD34 [Leptodactylus fuscus]|uniref:hematopoietic progenitor cell antigen CD34 n=1 Tax=Leptodactylus fuscus TaxID=238119 RepID=UPI003F4F2EF6